MEGTTHLPIRLIISATEHGRPHVGQELAMYGGVTMPLPLVGDFVDFFVLNDDKHYRIKVEHRLFELGQLSDPGSKGEIIVRVSGELIEG